MLVLSFQDIFVTLHSLKEIGFAWSVVPEVLSRNSSVGRAFHS